MIVRQAAHVLDLLEYFAQAKQPSTLAEISAAMGWPRSSTFNLLTTLARQGFLYEPRPRGGFYPSPRWLKLLESIAETERIPESLCSAADEVAKATGETVAVAAPVGTNAVFLHVVESPAVIRYSAQVGTQVPIHATAVGRALLAQYSQRERTSTLKRVEYEKFSAKALMSAAQVEAEIKRSATRGWHENIDTHTTDLTGVALAAGLPDRRLAIVVGGPTNRMRPRIAQTADVLKRALRRHLPAARTAGSC